jgi:hypothetical protein
MHLPVYNPVFSQWLAFRVAFIVMTRELDGRSLMQMEIEVRSLSSGSFAISLMTTVMDTLLYILATIALYTLLISAWIKYLISTCATSDNCELASDKPYTDRYSG